MSECVGGICVVDIERLTRWLDTSRRILVVATAILPGYRDCRSHPMHAQRLRPNGLFSHLLMESATVWKGRYFRHHSAGRALTILYRALAVRRGVLCDLRGRSQRPLRFKVLMIRTSTLKLLQLDFAAVIADCGHNIEGHGQGTAAIFQVNQRPGTALH